MNQLSKLNEVRVFFTLASILVFIYLIQITWSVVAIFVDIFLVIVLSWLLAFVLEPIVKRLLRFGLSRLASSIVVYIFLALATVVISSIIAPTVVAQVTQLSFVLPDAFANAPIWTSQLQPIISSALTNSASLIQSVASAAVNLLLVLIVSFTFVTEREETGKLILKFIPNDWKNLYQFLEKTVNTSFAEFLRIQLINGVLFFATSFIVLTILQIPYSLSVSLFAGLLATVPVIGPMISLIPPLLSAMLVTTQTGIIAVIILILVQQIIYNIIGPRLLGHALSIHPLMVLLSFIIGYKLAGGWGAVFAVPLFSSAAIVLKEFIKEFKND